MGIHLVAHSITYWAFDLLLCPNALTLTAPFTWLYACFLCLLLAAWYWLPLSWSLPIAVSFTLLLLWLFSCGNLSVWTLAIVSGRVGGVLDRFGFEVSIDWRNSGLSLSGLYLPHNKYKYIKNYSHPQQNWSSRSHQKNVGTTLLMFLSAHLFGKPVAKELHLVCQDVLCNDCDKKGNASFHWLYDKCGFCWSCKTGEIKVAEVPIVRHS